MHERTSGEEQGTEQTQIAHEEEEETAPAAAVARRPFGGLKRLSFLQSGDVGCDFWREQEERAAAGGRGRAGQECPDADTGGSRWRC